MTTLPLEAAADGAAEEAPAGWLATVEPEATVDALEPVPALDPEPQAARASAVTPRATESRRMLMTDRSWEWG
jgi:hypothetical protein